MIEKVVQDILQDLDEKAIICIYIPEGRAKASQTYNPKMGVLGEFPFWVLQELSRR
ncbi:cobalt-precorrin-6A synthase [Fusobacterium necrophorum subsp. necrophorum]|nr:cobalt-precorrin-6A synthase [Fusobacterium necrophorum subsp. necrophorum]